ncbi:MAG: urease accessory protein UreE [Paracoccaceae bacterium]|nr:urease accessory protein UreE [Paracoccaceae bacterium]
MSLARATEVEEGSADDHVALDYEGRFLRRRRLVSASGREFLVDLPETRSLDEGDRFRLDDGSAIAVVAAPEPLYAVTGANLARLAWHIGNRHTPARIEAERILIRADHVLRRMIEGLGGTVEDLNGPFQPEGGAYGTGRTLGHSHGDDHDHHHSHHV